MKYKVEFLLDNRIATEDIRDIKLKLLQEEAELFLISDYPISIPDKRIFIGEQLFNISQKDVKVLKDCHIIIATIIDSKTQEDIKKKEELTTQKQLMSMLSSFK